MPAALEEIAEEEGVGLIVVGSTHRGKLGRILPGSVGSRLIQGAPCAVVIAPVGYSQDSRTPGSIIGVGFDGGAESWAALAFAADLARRLAAELRVLAVARPVISAAQLAPSAPTFEEAQRKHMRELLREALGTVPDDVTATGGVVDGDPATELARAAPELDFLVIGSRSYGPVRRVLLGSVARAVMETAACPAIVLPRHGADDSRDADPERA